MADLNLRSLVLAEDAEGIRTLTLNRPAQLNAFDQALCAALTDRLDEATDDDTVRVVIVTGSGRAFSAGTDLFELTTNGDFRGTPADPLRFERLVDALADFSKPLVCAVNGIAVGIGATMLGHADLVVMADTATLRCPFTTLSLAPEAASSVTFPFLLGRQAAAWMLLSSDAIDADEAKAMGLAWKVVPVDQVLDTALLLARSFAIHPLATLVATKKLISATFSAEIKNGRARENETFDVLLRTPESRSAVRAFVAARRPTATKQRDDDQ